MQVVTSGIDHIDAAIGGGIIKGSGFLVLYDSFSSGWTLPFRILKRQIDRGVLGVFINYNLPLSRLLLRARSAGLDIEAEGKRGNLFVIDVFGSKYGSSNGSGGYVYTIGGFNPETYIPKLEQIYEDMFSRTDRTEAVDFLFSLDGMALELGEGLSIKLIRRLLSNHVINGRRLFSLYLLGVDRVSREFLSWNVEFSDYVIEFSSRKEGDGIYEEMYIIRSPLPQFEPRAYRYGVRFPGGVPRTIPGGRRTIL